MNSQHHSLLQLTKPHSLLQDYFEGKDAVAPFVSSFPHIEGFEKIISAKDFGNEKRSTLRRILDEQYKGLSISQAVQQNIDSLTSSNTFTITTGHQLCLFTGPLYFIYKIISAVRLSEELQKRYPERRFVPIYWMATEDHDLEEINHTFVYGKKLVWETIQQGAVGRMSTSGIANVIEQFNEILGSSTETLQAITLLQKAYSQPTLSAATRYLVNALMGQYGVVVIDADHKDFKSLFQEVMLHDLFQHTAYQKVNETNAYFTDKGYKIQVNPREVNLFYLEGDSRNRIEKKDGNKWVVVDTSISFSEEELKKEVQSHPEKFSPNVVLRPLFQEEILPNIAYIGGPGELTYWLQLKSLFDDENIPYPMLIHRDSALLLNEKQLQRLDKLGLDELDLFANPEEIVKRLANSQTVSLEEERIQIQHIFERVAAKMKEADNTLEKAALAEAQKQLSSIDHLEKKAVRALKAREENSINQFLKLHGECFPNDIPQERHDNYFQHLLTFGDDLIDILYRSFNPINKEYHIIRQHVKVH